MFLRLIQSLCFFTFFAKKKWQKWRAFFESLTNFRRPDWQVVRTTVGTRLSESLNFFLAAEKREKFSKKNVTENRAYSARRWIVQKDQLEVGSRDDTKGIGCFIKKVLIIYASFQQESFVLIYSLYDKGSFTVSHSQVPTSISKVWWQTSVYKFCYSRIFQSEVNYSARFAKTA